MLNTYDKFTLFIFHREQCYKTVLISNNHCTILSKNKISRHEIVNLSYVSFYG